MELQQRPEAWHSMETETMKVDSSNAEVVKTWTVQTMIPFTESEHFKGRVQF